VQLLAGPREVREGIVGGLLGWIVSISLVLGPICLLVLFQLQFLPYHSAGITLWHRIAVVLDLVLLWLLFLPIKPGETALLAWRDIKPVRVIGWLLLSLPIVVLVFTIATFPGEWLEGKLYGPPVDGDWLDQRSIEFWRVPHELLVGGRGLWSNVLMLPKFETGDRLKLDAEGKIGLSPAIFSPHGRRLEGAMLDDARFSNADFSGAELQGASLYDAQLQGANFRGAELQGATLTGAKLQGAVLDHAQLQGASLDLTELQGAQLQGAIFIGAKLQGATLAGARLQGATLRAAQLQGANFLAAELKGASLDDADLQGAVLDHAQLQGASLHNAQLPNATLDSVFVWRTEPLTNEQVEGAWIRDPQPGPIGFFGFPVGEPHPWSYKIYARLISLIEIVPKGERRDAALMRVQRLGNKPYDPEPNLTETWNLLATASERQARTYPERLTSTLISIGCGADGGPFVIAGLIPQLPWKGELSRAQRAEVARAFLDDANCPGSQGLSKGNRAELRWMRDAEPQQPSPDTTSR